MPSTMTSSVRPVEMVARTAPADHAASTDCTGLNSADGTVAQSSDDRVSGAPEQHRDRAENSGETHSVDFSHTADVQSERRKHPWGHGYVPIQHRRWSRQKLDVLPIEPDEPREVTAAEREDAPILRALAGYAL